jgi:hypothetical protein
MFLINWSLFMSAKAKKQQKSNQQESQQESTPAASGGYQTPLQEDIRKTGDARETATPEAPGEDKVAGSPNQGNPSR